MNGDEAFDALQWWRANILKFRVLSKMARDILSIPISTVASESTFNDGGKVIDQYRSSLKPETVKALICTSNWLRSQYKLGNYQFLDAATEMEEEESELIE